MWNFKPCSPYTQNHTFAINITLKLSSSSYNFSRNTTTAEHRPPQSVATAAGSWCFSHPAGCRDFQQVFGPPCRDCAFRYAVATPELYDHIVRFKTISVSYFPNNCKTLSYRKTMKPHSPSNALTP